MRRSRALDALLSGLVDYAGLFPPTALPMAEAVARYSRYAAGEHRRVLGRFVVPSTRLTEFSTAVEELGDGGPATGSPWRLSVLASADDLPAILAFNVSAAGRIVIDVVEAKADDEMGIGTLSRAFGDRFVVYVEIDARVDPGPLLRVIRDRGLRAKIRTGGITVDAFPSPHEIARFIAACCGAEVRFKATAGLHHPMFGEYPLTYAADGPRGPMFGFLGVFLAAVLVREGVAPSAVEPLLRERQADAIVVDADEIRWRDHRVSTARITAARESFAASFGSCSFEEPISDLSTLQLL